MFNGKGKALLIILLQMFITLRVMNKFATEPDLIKKNSPILTILMFILSCHNGLTKRVVVRNITSDILFSSKLC